MYVNDIWTNPSVKKRNIDMNKSVSAAKVEI